VDIDQALKLATRRPSHSGRKKKSAYRVRWPTQADSHATEKSSLLQLNTARSDPACATKGQYLNRRPLHQGSISFGHATVKHQNPVEQYRKSLKSATERLGRTQPELNYC
jgi:hypothetical protein